MNCLSIENFFDFIEGRLNEEEMTKFDMHIQYCSSCSSQFAELLDEEQKVASMFPTVNVDYTFTNQVMNQLPERKTVVTKKRDWRVAFTTVLVSAALLFVVFWSVQEKSLQTATNSSAVEISVKDVNITDALIEVTLTTSGYSGDELFLTEESLSFFSFNNISLVLPNGESKSIRYYGDQSKNEITFGFPLIDVPYAEFDLLFDFKNIYGIDGHWSLEVPIDRKKLLAKTEKVTLHSSFEKEGVNMNFIRAQHGPYHTLINFETKFTEDMATFVEQQVAKYTADLPLAEREHYINNVSYRAQILYEVIDADGQTLHRSNLEDTVNTQNDRYAHTETLGTYPRVEEGGYVSVIGAKFELPTNVRYELTVDQLPFSFSYKDTVYEVILLPDERLEISSDADTTTINEWHITVDNQIAWDTARLRTDNQKQFTTITFKEDIKLDSFILYGQSETSLVYFDEAIQVNLH